MKKYDKPDIVIVKINISEVFLSSVAEISVTKPGDSETEFPFNE